MIKILFEDNHLLVVQKDAGILVQSDITKDVCLLDMAKQYIKAKYNKPGDVFLGLVHRIDRPVAGIVILAKTSKALERLNKAFQNKTIQKIYWAVVEEKPPLEEEVITHYLKKNQEKNKSRAYEGMVKDAKESKLKYKMLGRSANYYYLEITPYTGRHHQIRTQLSHIGCPIKGDLKYGSKRTNTDGSIHLFAKSITFEHPTTKEEMTIQAIPDQKDPLWREMYKLYGN